MIKNSSFPELSKVDLGRMQNHLGLINDDGKGHRSLNPDKFLELTRFSTAEAAKKIEVSRPLMYKSTIPLKPSTKLTERVISLVTATDIAFELFDRNQQDTANWMMSPNTLLFGDSPFEVCMRGDAKPLIEWLLDRAGKEPVVR